MLASPLPWRKVTPLHRRLGARSIRFVYLGGAGLPLTASPQSLAFRYDAINAMDRIIGFTVSIANAAGPSDFTISELNTGWFYDFTWPGSKGALVQGNVETLPDEVNLQFSFSSAISGNVYVAFANIEHIPAQI